MVPDREMPLYNRPECEHKRPTKPPRERAHRLPISNPQLSEKIKRWTAKTRVDLVVPIIKGETTAQEAARQHGLKVSNVQDWYDTFLAGAENNLRGNHRNEEQLLVEQNKRLKQKVDELVMDIDILKEAVKPFVPYESGTSSE